MAQILLVEDDTTVRELVTLALQDHEHEVETAATGHMALDAWTARTFDLILLDIMLPEIDGVEVCRRIRAQDEHTPIVMLTARTDPIDVVLGLETGADDYVTKPFETRVLLARVKAALRRGGEATGPDNRDQVLRVGPLCVDTAAHTATVDGEPVSLTRTEWLLLAELARHPNQVLSRDQLLTRVWGYAYTGDTRLVDVGISRLRAKLGDDPSRPDLIQTRRGFGYLLTTP